MTADAAGPRPIELVLARLATVQQRQGGGWQARCPAHEDRHPSLSIDETDDGRVLLHCFAGCARARVLDAIGLREPDVRPGRSAAGQRTRPARRPRSVGPPPEPAAIGLAHLAAAKRLPVEFLRELGCDDHGGGVRIPYHSEDGTLTSLRTRLALAGDRFRWRRGDHPLLYGLWRLGEIRKAGWVLLVEGESDCWTLWHHGLPGLGIPGKGIWRSDWAGALDRLEVILWQEPDAEDLAERVARDVADLRIFAAPPEFKDVSEAHVGRHDVAALVERVRVEAVPARETRARQAEKRLHEAHGAAHAVLAHPDPLELVEAELRVQGYGGDLRAPLTGYLCATTRLLAPRRGSMAGHVLFVGPSSGGKNAAMQAALRLLPDEAVHVIDAGSPRVLIYDEAPLEHRVVVFGEADSLPAGEDNPAASAIRNLLQDGRLHYRVTVLDAATGGHTVRTVDKAGPTVLMTTSTRPLGKQLMTRLFTVEIPDEPAQVRAALAAQAALELADPPPPSAALIAFQRYLGALAPIDVIVPFADELQRHLGNQPGGPRVLRDFPRLLSLTKAAALMRIAHRRRDPRGRLVADIDDYRFVRHLVADMYEASAGASSRIRDAVAAVGALTAADGPTSTVTVSQVAGHLGISVASASRRVHDAIAGKWLINDESRRSQTAKLRLGEPLPATSGLPLPEALGDQDAGLASAVDLGVFTFAADPAGSRPPVQQERLEGQDSGRPSSVTPENVQTADGPPPALLFNFGIFGDDEEWGTGTA